MVVEIIDSQQGIREAGLSLMWKIVVVQDMTWQECFEILAIYRRSLVLNTNIAGMLNPQPCPKQSFSRAGHEVRSFEIRVTEVKFSQYSFVLPCETLGAVHRFHYQHTRSTLPHT